MQVNGAPFPLPKNSSGQGSESGILVALLNNASLYSLVSAAVSNMNTPPAHLSIAPLAASVLSSGLVSDDEWKLANDSSKGDPQELAKLLTSKGLLTQFQLTALNEGRGASLRVGNYDILDRLGAGGMGTVFKARHRRMKRIVALKVLADNLSENPLFVKRFQREVETIASLGHPNVVMAYDADEAEVGHFLVMEFVNGLDLAGCVERTGPLPIAQAVQYILQAARGLAYAHSQDIIHRDIKPQNLLCDESGVVKVTDLGLARLKHGAEGPAAGMDLTMAGGIIGTVAYMPPEQAVDSTTIDHRADIYSLGCTLHYLLTGNAPYSAPTMMALLLKHRDAEIPTLLQARLETPLQLDDLFRRMMAKQAEQRVQQMSEVVIELEAISRTLLHEGPVLSESAAIRELPTGKRILADAAVSTQQLAESTLAMDSADTPITVLVVEPSRVQAAIIKSYLQEHSLAVVGTAANGKDAIDAICSLRPKAVIAAMHLPDRNGVELAQQIREKFQVDAPGFVLITSESPEGESASLSKVNRVLVLAKPFTSMQMAEALNLVTGASMPLPHLDASIGEISLPKKKKDRDQLRVLIVDDSSTARIHVRTVLSTLGFSQFLEVPDGAHAIAVATRENCDLIVTDYNMPLMDGRALVSYLKQNLPTAEIPIVMVTTETEPRVLDPVRKLGVVAVFDKAFPAHVVGPILDSLF